MGVRVIAYCDDVNKNHVHCNRYTAVNVDTLDDAKEALEEKGWSVEEDETYCHECS